MSADIIMHQFYPSKAISHEGITPEQFIKICPLLVYEMDIGACKQKQKSNSDNDYSNHDHSDSDHGNHDHDHDSDYSAHNHNARRQDPDHDGHTHQEGLWDHDHDHHDNHTEVTGHAKSGGVGDIPFKGRYYFVSMKMH